MNLNRPQRRRSKPFVPAAMCALLAACSPLRTFNALVPKDAGGQLATQGLPYGGHARQRLDLYKPAQDPGGGRSGSLPIIVFIYGGSWQSGERQGYGFVGRALADQGFLVAIPDYRLVPEVHFPGFIQDNALAVRSVVANARAHGADPSRLILVGHSAGAYNAAMLALDPRWLGADRTAVKGFIGLAGPYDFELDRGITRAAFGQAPNFPATQPINFASRDDPPSLLLHGARDTTVYPRNSVILRDRLASAGVDARVKLYNNVGHIGILTAIARPLRGKAPVLSDISSFARAAVDTKGAHSQN